MNFRYTISIRFLSILMLAAFCTISSSRLFGQEISSEETRKKKHIEEQTHHIFELQVENARKHNFEGFAKYLAYDGSDPNRKLQSPVNYGDTFEKLETEHSANKLLSILDKYELYNLANFKTAKWMDREMIFWDLELTTKKGKVKMMKVTFIQIGTKFYYIRTD